MEIDRVTYWKQKRWKFNKALFWVELILVPLITFLLDFLYGFYDYSFRPKVLLIYLLIITTVYIVYVGYVNIVFIFLELLNNFFSKIKGTLRDTLFYLLLLGAIALPIGYLVFLLSFLI